MTMVEQKVAVLTLNQILEKHALGPIHFLKIDVEGAEKAVLQGLDLSRWRPWILFDRGYRALIARIKLNFGNLRR